MKGNSQIDQPDRLQNVHISDMWEWGLHFPLLDLPLCSLAPAKQEFLSDFWLAPCDKLVKRPHFFGCGPSLYRIFMCEKAISVVQSARKKNLKRTVSGDTSKNSAQRLVAISAGKQVPGVKSNLIVDVPSHQRTPCLGNSLDTTAVAGGFEKGASRFIVGVPTRNRSDGPSIANEPDREEQEFVAQCDDFTIIVIRPLVPDSCAAVSRHEELLLGVPENYDGAGLDLGRCNRRYSDNKQQRTEDSFRLRLKDGTNSWATWYEHQRRLVVTGQYVYISWDDKDWFNLIDIGK